MRFKLPRYKIDAILNEIISREVDKQELCLTKLSAKRLKEIKEICSIIEKQGLPDFLLCKKLPNPLGYGIFLHPKAKPILRGQIIAPYTGDASFIPQNEVNDSHYAFEALSDILLTKEEQARFDAKRRFHPRRLYAFCIDAKKAGNFTRFINHSEKPNVSAVLFQIPKNSYGVPSAAIEVIYMAKKRIEPGEQLLVCYEGEDKSYWGAMGIKPTPITPTTFRLNSNLKVVKKAP